MVAEVLVAEKIYTVAEYFELEEKAQYKSEFRNGKIVAMAGGTLAHSMIIGNIFGYLFATLADDFMVLNSEIAIFLPTYNHFVYADNCIVESLPKLYKNNKQAIINPKVIFEVASTSTAKYDRSSKFKKYKSLDTFEEYVLIDQEMPIVEVYFKNKDTTWQSNIYIGLEEEVHLQSVDTRLKMTDIYKKITDLQDPQILMDFGK